MDFEISISDVRNAVSAAEIDCLVSAEPQHRVGDLSAALLAMRGSRATALPGLWLDGSQLDPAGRLGSSGIRAGSRVGFGGPLPGSRGTGPGRRQERLRGQGWDAGPKDAETGLPELRVVSGSDAGLSVPLAPGENVVGRQGGNVRLSNSDVSRVHCVITVSAGGGCMIRDAGSRNGTGLDGRPVGPEPVPVAPGQLIYVGRDVLTITLPDAGGTIMLRADPANPFGWLVNKPFRSVPVLPDPVIIDPGGEQSRHGRPSWLTMLIAPAVSLATGCVVGALMHQWLFLLLGVGGVAASLVPQLVNRRTAAGHARAAKREFQDAAAAGQVRLADAIAAEEQLRRQALPDPASLARIAADPGTRLWERSPQDGDFLRLRAGSGDLPASTVSLRGDPGTTPGRQPVVRDVPVAMPLADLGVLGIAGPPAASRSALAWAVSQLAVLHGPSDLRLVLLTGDPDAWRWARWLPHLRPLGGASDWLSVGTEPATWTKRVTELRDLVARRHAAAAESRYGHGGPGAHGSRDPALVLVIDDSTLIGDVPGFREVLSAGPSAGVFTLCRADDWRALPGTCRGRLDTDPGSGGTGVYLERETGRAAEVARLDLVSERWAEETARALAPLGDGSGEGEAGANGTVRLLDLWGVQRPTSAVVSDLWRRGGRTTKVPLGRTGDGTPFTLDIASDGPHMLVAGTTGAGKSEFLQTLVASLALGNAPEALVFVLIDYKGGAAFASAARLPHVTGFLTNLDEHLGRRALVALRAESVYRQRMLADTGCPDIGSYHAAGEPRGPLPRLVLVVDEFAVLAERMPDFLGELTDVTRQGRSLGIHLVLATQRPAGVVTEDIRSNMALRVCLRVEDPQDSTAVIEIPDAARIDRRQRGHGYARVQRGAVVQFQGGYVGGPAPGSGPAHGPSTSLHVLARPFEVAGQPRASGQPADGPGAPAAESDLSALVAVAGAAGRQAPPHRAWLDPLPELISLSGLPAARASAAGGLPPVVYGAEDRPAEQAQRLLALDLETGTHLLIGGAPQSGRTTALRTIAARIAAEYSPADVQLYVLDCDAGALAPLQRLPHCGAVVRRTEKDRAARLLDRLAAEVTRRQELLSAAGFSSVTEQRRYAPGPDRMPYMVLLLDRWESFSEDLGQQDNMRLSGVATRLLSEGAGAGLRVVATGDKTALARVSSHFPERIVLRLANSSDLLLAGVPKGAMPDKPSQGRGVLLPEGTEVQIGFAGQDPGGAAQTAAVEALIERAAAAYPAPVPAPLRVDPLPPRITLAQARAVPGWAGREPLRPAVAVGGDDLAGLGADLTRFPGFAIAGPPLSGRSTALLVLATSLLETGTTVIGLAPRESPLRDLAGRDGVLAVFSDVSPDQRKLLELLEGASGPAAVLVDDAEALLGTPADALLAQIPVEGRARGQALVIAGTSGELARGMRSFAAAARQFKCGLLLTPDDAQQANLLMGTKLTRSAVFDRPPGRGYLVQAGQPTLVQVPELAVSW